jgi:vitamin K-dependent gamma-carboxylase
MSRSLPGFVASPSSTAADRLGWRARWESWGRALCLDRAVSAESLAFFRIAVGLVMLLEAVSLFLPSESSGGRSHLDVYYAGSEVTFHLPYAGFGWLPLLPSPWIQGVGVLLGLGAIGMGLGFRYRASALLTFLAWGYLYVVESTRTYWMSYYYLELLVLFLMPFLPAAARFSLDASKTVRAGTVLIPFWPLWLLRAQLVITYFYAGVAKLNTDWMVDAYPVRIFLEKPWVTARLKFLLPYDWAGMIERWVHSSALALGVSWIGAVFDLSIGLLLLVRRTRFLAIVLMGIFHGINHFILFNDIVWFPLLGLTTALIFLEPDWPSRVFRWLCNPRIPTPDWPWLWGGLVAVPGVGAALGWKGRSSLLVGQLAKPFTLKAWTVGGVVAWTVFQGLFPIRHALIPGDVRVTFEGLEWSWRLKSEVYQSTPVVISVRDSVIQPSTSGTEIGSIDWKAWGGDPVIYHPVEPGQCDWSKLPELVVLLDPWTGDRIVYNTLSASVTDRSETAAKVRIQQLWKQRYGRPPDSIHRSIPLARIVEGYERSMRARGYSFRNPQETLDALNTLNGRFGDGKLMPVLRRMDPFAMTATRPSPGVFLVIEDRQLMKPGSSLPPRINPEVWREDVSSGTAGPMRVFHEPLGMGEGDLLPRWYVNESTETDGPRVEFRWNLFRDVGPSKGMHLSTQPFLLRRYAQRVADAWALDQGRRPEVRARTQLSLNRRPFNPVVDPTADLASVSVRWFGHNSWILDLQRGRPGSLQPDGSGNWILAPDFSAPILPSRTPTQP